jgi:hypothetical protein
MMVLIRRTQQLDVNEWREIREAAYQRFGRECCKTLFEERDQQTPNWGRCRRVLHRWRSSGDERYLVRYRRKREIAPEWKNSLQAVHENSETGNGPDEVLRGVPLGDEQQQKLKTVRKNPW